jgi:hypothetical protein
MIMSNTNENYSQPFRFTTENAREMAARSWEARRKHKAKLETEAQQGRQSTPQSERLALLIERVEQMMEKTKDPDALQNPTLRPCHPTGGAASWRLAACATSFYLVATPLIRNTAIFVFSNLR